MTSRKIKDLNLPENECPIEGCPQYCRQWSSEKCLAAEKRGLACGLCQSDDGFMQPGECYDCVRKVKK